MKILLVDNFDSFTFNLVHYLESLDCEVKVVRNTEIDFEEALNFDKLVISPGPKLPEDSGDLMAFIAEFYNKKPILGVCLGMQALGHFFGDELRNLAEVKHGVSEELSIVDPGILFQGLPSAFQVGLYHSWEVCLKADSEFIPLAYSESGVLMAMQHKVFPLYGVQFHPESILTEYGKVILANFMAVRTVNS